MCRALGAQHASGWKWHFRLLDAQLEGGFLPQEDAFDVVEDLHEDYAERFGLDPEVGRRAIAEQRSQQTA